MTTYERRQSLLALLRTQPGLSVPEIARALSISDGTVRNDLNALEMEGLLIRVHGGAVLRQERQPPTPVFSQRLEARSAEKECIARWAAALVQNGEAILLDSSSTVYALALQLETRSHLRVVTNGLEAGKVLARNPSNTVILLGGVLSQDGSSLTGMLSEQVMDELHIHTAFVSASGFSLGRGLTDIWLEEAQLKRRAILGADQVYALLDSSKFGHEDLSSFARPAQITRLLTDARLSPAWQERLAQAGIPFSLCSEAPPPPEPFTQQP